MGGREELMKGKYINIEHDSIEISPTSLYAFIKFFPMLLIISGVIIVSYLWLPILSIVAIILLGVCWYRYLLIRFTVYTISSEVLKVKRGVFTKRIDSLELYRVKDYVVKQSFFMRLFNLMTVTLFTKDLTSEQLHLSGIPVSDLPDLIRKYVQQARLANKIFEIN